MPKKKKIHEKVGNIGNDCIEAHQNQVIRQVKFRSIFPSSTCNAREQVHIKSRFKSPSPATQLKSPPVSPTPTLVCRMSRHKLHGKSPLRRSASSTRTAPQTTRTRNRPGPIDTSCRESPKTTSRRRGCHSRGSLSSIARIRHGHAVSRVDEVITLAGDAYRPRLRTRPRNCLYRHHIRSGKEVCSKSRSASRVLRRRKNG